MILNPSTKDVLSVAAHVFPVGLLAMPAIYLDRTCVTVICNVVSAPAKHKQRAALGTPIVVTSSRRASLRAAKGCFAAKPTGQSSPPDGFDAAT
jgi:hypothetical protein